MRVSEFYSQRSDDGASVDGRIRKAGATLARFAAHPHRFLDVGCGAGVATAFLARAIGAGETHGVDISPNAVSEAASNGVRATAVDLDQDPLPFETGSMDAVHCGEVLEHVVDTDHLMAEIRRVMSAEAICVLSTPNLAAWHNRLALLAGYQPFLTHVSFHSAPGRPFFARANAGGGHLRVFTHRALLQFLGDQGFEIVASRGVGMFELGEPPGSALMKSLAIPLDWMLSRVPSLATASMVAIRKSAGAGDAQSA